MQCNNMDERKKEVADINAYGLWVHILGLGIFAVVSLRGHIHFGGSSSMQAVLQRKGRSQRGNSELGGCTGYACVML
jgi:hypothetical protein